jgi:hypothetical protein
MHPRARRAELQSVEVNGGIVIYDERTYQAHDLNECASFVWRNADGRTSVEEIAGQLEREFGGSEGQARVLLAIDDLQKVGLLETTVPGGQLARRKLLRQLAMAGVAAAMLPAVQSITAPTAATAQSIPPPNPTPGGGGEPVIGTVTFTFEEAGVGGNVVYGTSDTAGFPAFVRSGFILDVIVTIGPAAQVHHFHEIDSIGDFNNTIPDRPAAQRGVLLRDGNSGGDPLVFTRQTPTSKFMLDSLVAAASQGSSAGTTGVQVAGFLAGNPVGVTVLPVTTSYATYSGLALGALNGVVVDRLEFIGLSGNPTSASFNLDDVVLKTID